VRIKQIITFLATLDVAIARQIRPHKTQESHTGKNSRKPRHPNKKRTLRPQETVNFAPTRHSRIELQRTFQELSVEQCGIPSKYQSQIKRLHAAQLPAQGGGCVYVDVGIPSNVRLHEFSLKMSLPSSFPATTFSNVQATSTHAAPHLYTMTTLSYLHSWSTPTTKDLHTSEVAERT
jgi:hypothetical protein